MEKIKGTVCNSGIAQAKIFILKDIQLNVSINNITHDKIKNIQQKINDSFKKVKDNNVQILKTDIDKTQKEIIEAHIMLINDDVVKKEVKDYVDKNLVGGDNALFHVYEKYYKQFQQMEDEYFKERLLDIVDIRKQLILEYQNRKNIDLENIKDVIIVAYDITPAQTSQIIKNNIKGFITEIGGRTSHTALIARNLKIPMISGIENIFEKFSDCNNAIIDSNISSILINPEKKIINEYSTKIKKTQDLMNKIKSYRTKKTKTLDNYDINVEANIGNAIDAGFAQKNGADGVGLFRTEFLYMENSKWPTEEEQYEQYLKAAKEMNGKQIVIRTLDIGGDKKLKYYSHSDEFGKELNPFLGIRAIRLCLLKKEIFRTQIIALLKVSKHYQISIMIPMISILDEFLEAKKIINEEAKKIGGKLNYRVGMMVETPAAVFNLDAFFQESDFFSIGTNDLIQYTMAADRLNNNVSYLYQPLDRAIINALKIVIKGSTKNNIECAVCGSIAGDKQSIPILLGLGLKYFSVSSSIIPRTRYIINNLKLKDCEELVNKILKINNNKDIIKLVNLFLKKNNLLN